MQKNVENEKNIDFDDMMKMKEKRRQARSKGKRTYEKTKIHPQPVKKKNGKKISYDPTLDYDDYDYDQF